MATSAIPFLITSGQPAGKCACFFILSTVFRHPQDSWGGQFFSILFLFPFSFPLPPTSSLGQPASSSISHTSFLYRKPLIAGGRRPSWQPPMTSQPREKGRLVGRSFPVRGGWQPSSPELWGGLSLLVMDPWRLWWATPPHWGMEVPPHSFGNIFFKFLSSVNFS